MRVIRLSVPNTSIPLEPLTSVAGSLGYVAPEVLSHNGYGKLVDLWSIG